MDKTQIYLDTNILIGPIKKMLENKEPEELGIVKFLNETNEIESYISILSLAEMVKVMKYDDDFKKYHLNYNQIRNLMESLQNLMEFNTIQNMELENTSGKPIRDIPNGIVLTNKIIKYSYKHGHVLDCLHTDLAKTKELIFVTTEGKIGNLKNLYGNIMTFNKLTKQF